MPEYPEGGCWFCFVRAGEVGASSTSAFDLRRFFGAPASAFACRSGSALLSSFIRKLPPAQPDAATPGMMPWSVPLCGWTAAVFGPQKPAGGRGAGELSDASCLIRSIGVILNLNPKSPVHCMREPTRPAPVRGVRACVCMSVHRSFHPSLGERAPHTCIHARDALVRPAVDSISVIRRGRGDQTRPYQTSVCCPNFLKDNAKMRDFSVCYLYSHCRSHGLTYVFHALAISCLT